MAQTLPRTPPPALPSACPVIPHPVSPGSPLYVWHLLQTPHLLLHFCSQWARWTPCMAAIMCVYTKSLCKSLWIKVSALCKCNNHLLFVLIYVKHISLICKPQQPFFLQVDWPMDFFIVSKYICTKLQTTAICFSWAFYTNVMANQSLLHSFIKTCTSPWCSHKCVVKRIAPVCSRHLPVF